MQKVYIISGTLGAGKTTAAKLLAKHLKDAALISADIFLNDMLVNPDNPPWEDRLKFMWSNVIHTAQVALNRGLHVVIEGVVEDEFSQLQAAFAEQELYYCILLADKEILNERIKTRGDVHMIGRSNEVLEIQKLDPQKQPYIIDTSHLTSEAVLQTILKLAPVQ